ncbi:MAG: Gfo/Idh/MocA family oxidoreductase [Victivallaceae bacterium]|nr:Gfo/Idh/MocA family oxidoreductase [Victivallaceae bacterium]
MKKPVEGRVKIAVIGLGPNGKEHLANYQAHPHAEVVAVCDKDENLAKEVAEQYKIPAFYKDLSILERRDIDAVSVCAPNPFHGEYTIRALELGKHVFVEKPMALEVKAVEKIVELWCRTKLTVMVGLIRRFNPLSQLVKRLIDEGILGELFYLESDYIHDLRGYRHPEDPFGSDGIHPLDILRWYAGDVVEVQAYSNRKIWSELEYPTTVAIYKFKNDCIGKVTVTWVPIGNQKHGARVFGSKATIVNDKICLTGTNEFIPLPVENIKGHSYKPEDIHFIDCLLQGKEPLINCLEGAKSTLACLLVKNAIIEKKPIAIPQFDLA